MQCPRCGFDSPDEIECPRCGVVFAKLERRAVAGPLIAEPRNGGPEDAEPQDTEVEPEDQELADAVEGVLYTPPEPADVAETATPLSAEARRALTVGFGLAVLVLAVPFLRFALSYLGVLVHELGHSAVSWLFGYPAIPALDFTYGGGVSLTFGRRPVLVVSFLLALVLLLGWAWRHPRWRWFAGAAVGMWILASLTALHEVVILAMGHAAELLFAALCLHRAITGEGTERRVERPLYAMVGWFLVLEGIWFAWGLLADSARREAYEGAKGGGHWMDFSRLADEYLGVDLSLVAAVFLAACVATPVLVLLAETRFLDSTRPHGYPSPEI